MLRKENFTVEHVDEVRAAKGGDPLLIERTIFAFGLLEALVRVGLKFTFKGGTSLMLLLKKPRRLSTDIDIIVEPGTDPSIRLRFRRTPRPCWRQQMFVSVGSLARLRRASI